MSPVRKILVTTALSLTALGVAAPAAQAAGPTPVPSADTQLDLSDHNDVAGKRKCRWVWGHGVVCEVPWGTINL